MDSYTKFTLVVVVVFLLALAVLDAPGRVAQVVVGW